MDMGQVVIGAVLITGFIKILQYLLKIDINKEREKFVYVGIFLASAIVIGILSL